MDAELVIVADAEALAREAARRIAALAHEAVAARGLFSAALSGGSTPGTLYRLLAEEPYRSRAFWTQVHLFWTDERCVPPGDAGSNYWSAYQALIAHVPIPPENVHRVRGELAPEAAARAYEREMQRFFRRRRPDFDLVLLGLGSDGHTASLFPNSGSLAETERLAVATTAVYSSRPAKRVTLTLPALNAARQILFLVSGHEKAEIVRAVFEDVEGRLPARRVRPAAGQLTWLVDAAAAARVPNGLPLWPLTVIKKRL
jgi:6-phosphogluconolactonase